MRNIFTTNLPNFLRGIKDGHCELQLEGRAQPFCIDKPDYNIFFVASLGDSRQQLIHLVAILNNANILSL
jgi:hypothetical protein